MAEVQFGEYRTEGGYRTCLYLEGRKYLRVLTLETPLALTRVPATDLRYIHPLTRKGAPYPLSRALKAYRRARKHGITKSAAAVLKSAAAQTKGKAS